MIEIRDLGFAYDGDAPVLDAVSLHVTEGEALCLAGANGSGKSTLLAILAGLYAPSSGCAVVAGHTAPGAEAAIRTAARLVLQDADLQMLGASVEEDLFLGLDEAGRDEALALAERFGLGELMERPVHALSYGQKRKLCLATALAARPKVLLLDEPFSGLDYPAATQMRAILREGRAANLTQIVSAHDLEPVIDLVDRLAVLDHGRLALLGTPDEVLAHVAAHGVRAPGTWNGPGSPA